MSLYAIDKEYENILNNLHDEHGEINQEALARLEENQAALEDKAIAVASFIKNMDAEREAITAAKKAMTEREQRYKKRCEQLESYLLFNMEKRGINNIKCPYFEVKLKTCPASVDILDEACIPEEYRRTKTEVSLDKVKMLSEMKNGVIIPGAAIKHNLKLNII